MSVVSTRGVKDIVPTAKLRGGVRGVQVDVGSPLLLVPHTFAVKPVLLAETTSTPVRMYPDGFEPVVNTCARRLCNWVLSAR